MSSKIFVGNLNFDTTEQGVRAHFGAVGTIVDVHIPTNRDTGRPRGFAFVTFSSPEEAAQALESMHGTDLDGRTLRVDRAEERKPRRFDGGGGGGGRFGGGPRGGGGPRFDDGGGGGGFDGGFDRGFDDFGGGRGDGPPKFKKGGGSRRGLRAKKRSL